MLVENKLLIDELGAVGVNATSPKKINEKETGKSKTKKGKRKKKIQKRKKRHEKRKEKKEKNEYLVERSVYEKL